MNNFFFSGPIKQEEHVCKPDNLFDKCVTHTESRDFKQGVSFRCRPFEYGITYHNDEFVQDFVIYNGAIYMCSEESVTLSPEEAPSKWVLAVSNGTDGTNGKSAYQIWLDLGNEGTIVDFLEYFRGYTGKEGPQGPQGVHGNKISIGSGVPTISGANDDLYINSDNGNVYKFDSIWKLIGSLGTKISLVEATEQLTDFEKSAVRSNLEIDKIFDWEEL